MRLAAYSSPPFAVYEYRFSLKMMLIDELAEIGSRTIKKCDLQTRKYISRVQAVRITISNNDTISIKGMQYLGKLEKVIKNESCTLCARIELLLTE